MKQNDIIFFFVFICLIGWMCMSYSELGNFEFFILLIIFISYLLYLILQKPSEYFNEPKKENVDVAEETNVDEEEQNSIKKLYTKFKILANDLQTFPIEIKNRFGSELDRMITNVIPKAPNGDFVGTTSIDQYFFNDPDNKNPSYTKKMATEYMLIDKLFRDMRNTNIDNYKQLFYP